MKTNWIISKVPGLLKEWPRADDPASGSAGILHAKTSTRFQYFSDWKSALHLIFGTVCGATLKHASLLLLSLVLLACFVLLQSCSEKAAQCPLCERDVHDGMQVKITHNTIPMQTCCMACALTFKVQTKNVEIKSATDFLSGASIDPKNAVYVVASDVSPCTQDPKVQKFVREPHSALHACYDRCEPGILAFRVRSEAHTFQKQHGGLIREYEQLPALIAVKGRSHHDQ